MWNIKTHKQKQAQKEQIGGCQRWLLMVFGELGEGDQKVKVKVNK